MKENETQDKSIKKSNLDNKFIIRILIGLVIGSVLGVVYNQIAAGIGEGETSLILQFLDIFKIFGILFVSALKAVAPILVFVLVIASLANHKKGEGSSMGSVVKLYLVATFLAALVAVIMNFLFPIDLILSGIESADQAAPDSVLEVLKTTILNVVDNPINALANANYLGVLFWAVLLGLGLSKASTSTKTILTDLSESVSFIVRKVISFAPLGIFGLVFQSISENGLIVLLNYSQLLFILLGTMLIMIFGIFAVITFYYTKENPYPLIFKILKTSGLTAFFTRSSAANIPINLNLCEELNVSPDLYNVSIPLGSTINMSGAAITITTLSLAAAHTVGIEVPFFMAVILSVLAAVSACGASGVAGGSLLLVPLGCTLLGVDPNVAMQVVGVGFVISVIQDSCETALNSSTDALFTIIVDKRDKRLKNKQ